MNKTSDYKFTIIVPIYNEEDSIYRLEKELTQFINKSQMSTAILFVNDGSKDSSLEKVVEICDRNKDLYYINFDKNAGLSAAIKAGFDTIESAYIGYIDADLQTSPEDFHLLLEHIENHELVTGVRVGRKDTIIKRASSLIANGFRRALIGDGIKDTGCPLKVIRKTTAQNIPMFKGMHRFLAALTMLQNGTVKQIPVRHFPRTEGESKFHLFNRLFGPLKDCFAFRWMRTRYINYSISSNNINSNIK